MTKRNNKGMSLIEVMIAMSVMLFVFLALMQTALLSIDNNMVNVLREKGTALAEASMSGLRNTLYNALGTANPNSTVMLSVRSNVLNTPFYITNTVTDYSAAGAKHLSVNVSWTWKGENYSHSLSTVRRSSD